MSGIAGEQAGQRSHARRNHELLVATAREVFAERGVDGSLEEIARRAGVGIGTLYRHFATRDALIEAVFERRIGELRRDRRGGRRGARCVARIHGLPRGDAEAAVGRPHAQGRALALRAGCGARASARGPGCAACSSRCSSARTRRVSCAPTSASPISRFCCRSFAPLTEASSDDGSNVWARHLHVLLDGLRTAAATPQSEPPLSDEDMRVLRERRMGRRA